MFRATPSRYAARRQAVATPTSLPPPIGGLNARDAIANMPVTDAVVLDNWFPQRNALELRRGYRIRATSAACETLIPLKTVAGTAVLVGARESDNAVVVVPNNAAVSVTLISGAGLTNARWQYTTFTNAFVNLIVAVNGDDDPFTYDGTSVVFPTYTAESGDTVDQEDFIGVCTHHRRLWFVEKESTSAWFGGVDEIQGTVTRFDFGEMFGRGGYLMAVGTWTVDSGAGLNDLLVAISSEGDVVVYQGIDPQSYDFTLVGRFTCAAPLGRRCMENYAGDLLILTREGLVQMSALVARRDASEKETNLTDKIQSALSDAASLYGANFGWQVQYVPEFNQLYVNVPVDDAAQQFVMNTITKAWCRFTGYNATCWCLFDDSPHFSSEDVNASRAYYNYADGVQTFGTTSVGTKVNTRAVQAFSYFESPGRQKHFRMARPVFIAAAIPTVAINLTPDFEYDDSELNLPPASAGAGAGVWDASLWDAGYWGGSMTTFKRWYTVNPIGFCAAVAMQVAGAAQTQWVATDVVYESGGVL